MAGYAFEGFKLILHPKGAIDLCLFVTSIARYFGMLAFQFKIGFIVVELDSFPVVVSMAMCAIGFAISFELFSMNVFMAF